jgi:hypothetical protein
MVSNHSYRAGPRGARLGSSLLPLHGAGADARPFLTPAELERRYRPFRMLITLIPPAAFAAR